MAPADGEISSTFDTHHAVGMITVDGAELLMHIGIDTVKLGGKHFTYLVNEGDKVRKGQPLIRFDIEAIKAEGYPVTTPLIVCNTDEYAAVTPKASGTVKQGDALLELKGLTAKMQEDGSVVLRDSEGNAVYGIPAPYMEDAKGASLSLIHISEPTRH